MSSTFGLSALRYVFCNSLRAAESTLRHDKGHVANCVTFFVIRCALRKNDKGHLANCQQAASLHCR
jgi:hypothetical protein